MSKPELEEGTEAWGDHIAHRTAEHVLALADMFYAYALFERLVQDWDKQDHLIQSALFQSAVVAYARPFTKNKTSSGGIRRFSDAGLKDAPGFEKSLHDHICLLRKQLIAHHDTTVVKMRLGHTTVTPQPGKHSLAVQTHGIVKSLHTIAKKEIAERYLRHIAASVSYLYAATNEWLGKLHMARVWYPDLRIKKMQQVQFELEKLSDRRFRLPSGLMGIKPISEPSFSLPADSYLWRELQQSFVQTGTYSHVESGEPVLEIFRLVESPTVRNDGEPL